MVELAPTSEPAARELAAYVLGQLGTCRAGAARTSRPRR